MWRVGHVGGPLEFTPLHLYGWSNRFDDPEGVYRTLYAAETRSTALREVLQDFRPNAAVRSEFQEVFGTTSDLEVMGSVPHAWLRKRVLVSASARR